MKELLIFDQTMDRVEYTPLGHTTPSKFKWKFATDTSKSESVVFYSDDCIRMENKIGDVKIAWLIEPEEYLPHVYEWVRNNYNEFDYIFTWDKSLLELSNKFIFYNHGNSWILDNQISIYPKSKLLSMVASWKNFMSGHVMRHEILNKYKNKYNIHWFGKRGFEKEKNNITPFDPLIQNTIKNLVDAYKDYMFTIVVENVIQDYEFTEKIVSPILCGTIPIYHGCPSIDKFFNIKGIIIFNSIEELDNILNNLSEQKYYDMLCYAKENFEIAKKYQIFQDSMFDTFIKKNIIND